MIQSKNPLYAIAGGYIHDFTTTGNSLHFLERLQAMFIIQMKLTNGFQRKLMMVDADDLNLSHCCKCRFRALFFCH
jgi:hypothetical protein